MLHVRYNTEQNRVPYIHESFLWTNKMFKLEKAMAHHSSTLSWKIPWTEEPGGLQSMGSLGVGYD